MQTAIVVVHGMGEQIPMTTLEGFVKAAWIDDATLIEPGKPDPTTGGKREKNVVWSRPDTRNNSFELRRLTTETDTNGRRADFYEFYWAHLVQDTTFEHVKAWIFDLLFRNPFKRVPPRLRVAWALMWLAAVVSIGFALFAMLPVADEDRSAVASIFAGVMSVALGLFVSNVLVKRFGDVARYVRATPPNVARRQEIREKGVALLETLMDSRDDSGKLIYDRIVVVGHSLGSIVAYDVLYHAYARRNRVVDNRNFQTGAQPARARLEEMIRSAAGLPTSKDPNAANAPAPLDIDEFQSAQSEVRKEYNALGNPWIVSDFVTIGSPLTHAEFLLAHDKLKLRDAQAKRILPTCPPQLEFDGRTGLRHFAYADGGGPDDALEAPRRLHHAALFGMTRWTNIYSPHAGYLFGDVISGPLADQFGLKVGGTVVAGIKDVAVLPALQDDGKVAGHMRRTLLTHLHYWSAARAAERSPQATPHHIKALRDALKLGEP